MPESLRTFPAAGESTLIDFYGSLDGELDKVAKALLSYMARSLMERGWLPTVEAIIKQLSDQYDTAPLQQAVATLCHQRVLEVDATGARVVALLGGLSLMRTHHRAVLGGEVDVFTYGGFELLTLNPMLAKPVDAFSQCGQCQTPLKLSLDKEAIVAAEPTGIAGFQANWDGVASLQAVARQSPLFCCDTCLESWLATQPGLEGLPMSGDLLLFVGMSMAHASGNARFELIRHG